PVDVVRTCCRLPHGRPHEIEDSLPLDVVRARRDSRSGRVPYRHTRDVAGCRASPGRYANLRMAFRVVPDGPCRHQLNSVILPVAIGPRSPGDGQEGETEDDPTS